jgi:hypothetical protein
MATTKKQNKASATAKAKNEGPKLKTINVVEVPARKEGGKVRLARVTNKGTMGRVWLKRLGLPSDFRALSFVSCRVEKEWDEATTLYREFIAAEANGKKLPERATRLTLSAATPTTKQKAASKKAATKKSATKKSASKKSASKKAATKKPASKKAAAKKA